MQENVKPINKQEAILVIVGSLLLVISLILINYERIIEVYANISNEIKSEIFKETTSINSGETVNVDVQVVDEDQKIDNETISKPNYIAYLEIEKIGLNRGLLSKTAYYNKVDYNIEILGISDFPDVENGNFILAGHSGTSNVAFFKNLYKLSLDDIAKVYYNQKVYTYQIVDIYKQVKVGAVNIYRDTKKTTLTLITCTQNDQTNQTIYILELIGVQTY